MFALFPGTSVAFIASTGKKSTCLVYQMLNKEKTALHVFSILKLISPIKPGT